MVNGKYQIRKAELEDINSVKEIEVESGLSYWSKADYECELSRQDCIFTVVVKSSEIIGFLLARLITNQNVFIEEDSNDIFIELYNIGIKSDYRKKGLGQFLLEDLISIGESSKAEYIFLEVRKSNEQAIKLYNKYGFEIICERKELYRDPVENGLGMKLCLIKNIELDMN